MPGHRKLSRPPEICPNCGAAVPSNAKACPDCGSDEQTGWSEEAANGDLGLPDESFNYDKFVEEEFGEPRARPRGIAWGWWMVALAVLALFLLALMP
jgi:hypothetical protein